jgi:hypothetical protein
MITYGQHDLHIVAVRHIRWYHIWSFYLPQFRTLQIQLLVVASLFFYGYGQPELLPLLAIAVLGTYLFLILALRLRRGSFEEPMDRTGRWSWGIAPPAPKLGLAPSGKSVVYEALAQQSQREPALCLSSSTHRLSWLKYPSSMAASEGTTERSLELICICAQLVPHVAGLSFGLA